MSQDQHYAPLGSGGDGACDGRKVQSCSDEIDVATLLRVIWRRKVWIVAATSMVTLAAIGYALVATEWFRAEVVLIPREGPAPGGLSAQLAQLGGLADMAGLAIGQGSKQEPLGVLRSVGFARRFVEQSDLISALSEEVGPSSEGGHDAARRRVDRVVEKFRKSVFTILEDKKTGLITVVIEWKDPVVAASWANAIPRQLNEEMRQRALNEATRNVQFLQDQLAHTEAVSLQQAIARLMESEMQKLMLAQGADEYSLRVIDDAQPSSKRSRPKRTLLVLVAFAAGLFVSLLGAIVLDPIKAVWREVRRTSE